MGKQSQLLLQPTKVELGLQVGVEFDKNIKLGNLAEPHRTPPPPLWAQLSGGKTLILSGACLAGVCWLSQGCLTGPVLA